MEQRTRDVTRRSLHVVAELLVAGPQYAESGDIRLRVVPGGFGTFAAPDLRVEGTELVTAQGRHPITGSLSELAEAAGLEARPLADVYSDVTGAGPDEQLVVDEDAANEILFGFERGDAALRALAPEEEPVLWPEHFDIGVSVGEVNFGVSPGDAYLAEPYAYVGPWTPRLGEFWNAPFGAARPLRELADADAVERFFREGARLASAEATEGGTAEPGADSPEG